MGTTSAIPLSRRTPDFSEESEVELLSPYEMGSLSPSKIVPPSTRVRRTRVDRSHEKYRSMAIAGGAFLIVAIGLSAGVLAVLLSGVR